MEKQTITKDDVGTIDLSTLSDGAKKLVRRLDQLRDRQTRVNFCLNRDAKDKARCVAYEEELIELNAEIDFLSIKISRMK